MKILLVAAEVAPFAKVGGLADVAGALPKSLAALGHDVRVAMPCYKMIEKNPAYGATMELADFPVPVRPGVTERAFVKRTSLRGLPDTMGAAPDIPVYLIGSPAAKRPKEAESCPGYFQEATESKRVYTYAPEPYVFFCRAVLEMLSRLSPEWTPDIIHCNDWHTGLIPTYLHEFYADSPTLCRAATVFTIHNLAYQGNFTREQWASTGLPDSYFSVDGLEFYGEWTFMKSGLLFADRVNTVSETYAREIQTMGYGCGLQGLLQTLHVQEKLSGILNGIDYEVYDPAADPTIPAHFSAEAMEGKAVCKAALQTEMKLPKSKTAAVIGLVSRLADQKGLDLIHAITEKLLELPVQFILLGTGDSFYEEYFTELQAKYPRQVRANITFDVALAQRIYAGSDLFLMPSRFEPCGLGQMMSLRYGTIPIVRATGGLADTVTDFVPKTQPDGNGFVFSEYDSEALFATVERAVTAFKKKSDWNSLVHRALTSDFSWSRSAQRYAALYAEAQALHLVSG